MMPACTGLPPGELICNTMACEPSSSNAARKALTVHSALASAPSAISPLIATTAVCGWLGPELPTPARCKPAQANVAARTNHANRKNMRQRRPARCSAKVANAKRSKVSRSHTTLWLGADGLLGCWWLSDMSGVKEEIQKVLSCKQYASGPRHLFQKGQS